MVFLYENTIGKIEVESKEVNYIQQIFLVNLIYADIWACMVYNLKVGASMVFLSENNIGKFELESKVVNNIQQII